MKKILFSLICLFLSSTWAFAQQNFPQGMQYQAVARSAEGKILINESIHLKIKLHGLAQEEDQAYIETHDIKTNKLGLFNLIIGEGIPLQGNFKKIPWSTEDIFISLFIMDKNTDRFIELNESKLMAVPYAFHALTANKLSNSTLENSRSAELLPHEVWSTFGNGRTDDTINRLGTLDGQDLVVISNNEERMRLGSDGNIQLTGNTEIAGGLDVSGIVNLNTRGELTTIGGALQVLNGSNSNLSGNLTVRKRLNVTGQANFSNSIFVRGNSTLNRSLFVGGNARFNKEVYVLGATTIKNKLTVSNGSSTFLSGDLTVDARTILLDALRVENGALTFLSGDLIVEGATNFKGGVAISEQVTIQGDLFVDGVTELNDNLNVDGATTLNDSLYVDGPTLLNDELIIDGKVSINSEMELSTDTEDGGYVATFENTNAGDGDGIKIKLGRKATKNGGGFNVVDGALKVFVGDGFGPDEFSSIKALFDGEINNDDAQFLAEMFIPEPEDALAIAASACILAENVTDLIFTEINGVLDDLVIPAVNFPRTVIDVPVIPTFTIAGFQISPEIDLVPAGANLPTGSSIDFECDALGDGFVFPSLDFNDQSNTLTSENTFIEFTDHEDWTMGGITAQSIDEWAAQYLDPIFLYGLYSTFKGLDKSQVFPEVRTLAKEVAESYLEIGVEYSSGNGDYAEWLERKNPEEKIDAGDIVAVVGGKITKDLEGAEQVMAVSYRPIVLGNIPKEGEKHLGNNVAFMGQIPVKIMGPVSTGDYIVGKSNIPGYGIAINPANMTVEDFKLAIGRSWDANNEKGPKMVNTVVGVHNGDYLNILKNYAEKIHASELRLESVEAKVEMLSKFLTDTASNN